MSARRAVSWAIGPKLRSMVHAMEPGGQFTACGLGLRIEGRQVIDPPPRAQLRIVGCTRCWPTATARRAA